MGWTMGTRVIRSFLALAIVGLAAGAAFAQQPRIGNAKMQTRSAAAGLDREFRAAVAVATEPTWIGYAMATLSDGQMCCWDSADSYRGNNCCGRCRLERGENQGISTCNDDKNTGGKVKLEAPRNMVILFRAENKLVEKIRTFSEDCEIDAGGVSVVWLTDVKPAESVALLATFVGDDGAADEKPARSRLDGAVSAVALHADASADRAMESFIAAGQPDRVREQAIFWLGSARGARGFEMLKKIVREDSSPRIREKAVFALYVSRQAGATDEIIRAAKEDASSKVRGQALFWLAQKAGSKAAGAITAAIENDPDTEVKKKAVFALSQLPKDDGVPKLIEVARNNRNPAVRKQAMFWLGQSNDPRALSFFEEVLKR